MTKVNKMTLSTKNTRVCLWCKTEKPLTDFVKDKYATLGYAYRCKPCGVKICLEWRRKNAQKCRDYTIAYGKRFPEKVKECTRKWREKNKDYYLKSQSSKMKIHRDKNPLFFKNKILKYQRGITLEDYNRMLKDQNGCCAICKKPETSIYRGKLKYLSVDHCHKTNKNRGLLCGKCNMSLGLMGENPEYLVNMIYYINKYAPPFIPSEYKS